MTTEELEEILEGAEEIDSLEFKQAMTWSKNSLVKDILAMANIENGGRIIFGVTDDFQRQGLTEEQIASFDLDTMRDHVGEFADPYVRFSKAIVEDVGGRKYVVVDVAPFDDVPVICRRDGAEVVKGAIYYRSRTRRPQSAMISNSGEMRDLIDIAVVRRARRNQRIGLAVRLEPGYNFDAELGGL
ncbi:ATP-binding protein [Metarhizobium album]|uniref:ATP-binding protein n=1 Tax=Metarhizobium album TaxID=2182425 RepID=A0A2U2DXF2_9HYPH|nr:ATP-binding protein [Rhizobium album]PWE57899.1 ATP-binding protein [Rhizobium album]